MFCLMSSIALAAYPYYGGDYWYVVESNDPLASYDHFQYTADDDNQCDMGTSSGFNDYTDWGDNSWSTYAITDDYLTIDNIDMTPGSSGDFECYNAAWVTATFPINKTSVWTGGLVSLKYNEEDSLNEAYYTLPAGCIAGDNVTISIGVGVAFRMDVDGDDDCDYVDTSAYAAAVCWSENLGSLDMTEPSGDAYDSDDDFFDGTTYQLYAENQNRDGNSGSCSTDYVELQDNVYAYEALIQLTTECNPSDTCCEANGSYVASGSDTDSDCAATGCYTGSCDGAGACQYATEDTDPNTACGTTGCLTGNCDATGSCKIYSDGIQHSCSSCYYCGVAPSASCVVVPDDTDPSSNCADSSYTCSGSGSPDSCERYQSNTGNCDGTGSCKSETTNVASGSVCEGGLEVVGDADSYSGYSPYNDWAGTGSPYKCQIVRDKLACDGSGGTLGPVVSTEAKNVISGKVADSSGSEIIGSSTYYSALSSFNDDAGSGSPYTCSKKQDYLACDGAGGVSGSDVGDKIVSVTAGYVALANGNEQAGSSTYYSSSDTSDRCDGTYANGFGDRVNDAFACDGAGGVSGSDVGDLTTDCGTGCCYDAGSTTTCEATGTYNTYDYYPFGGADTSATDYCLSSVILDCFNDADCSGVADCVAGVCADGTGPVIVITSYTATIYEFALTSGDSLPPTRALSWTVDETIDWCGYGLDGAAYVTITSGSNVEIDEDTHTINVSCNDTSGNLGYSAAVNFEVQYIPVWGDSRTILYNYTTHSIIISDLFTDRTTPYDIKTVDIIDRAFTCVNYLNTTSATQIRPYFNCTGAPGTSEEVEIYITDNNNDQTEEGFDEFMEMPNTLPTRPSTAAFNDTTPQDNEDIECVHATSTDSDGDAVTYDYRWFNNSTQHAELDGEKIALSGNFTSGELWSCEVRAYDGYEYSAWKDSALYGISASIVSPTVVSYNATNGITGINSSVVTPTNNNSWINLSVTFTDPNPTDAFTAYFCDSDDPYVGGCGFGTWCSTEPNSTDTTVSCRLNISDLDNSTYEYYVFVIDNVSLPSPTEEGTFNVNHPPTIPTLIEPSSQATLNYTWINFSSTDDDSDVINYTIYNSTDEITWSILYNGEGGYNWTDLVDDTYYTKASARDEHGYGDLENSSVSNFTVASNYNTLLNSVEILKYDPPQFAENITFRANVTDDYDTITVNFTLTSPTGINYTNNGIQSTGDYWNSTSFTINETGIWNYNITSNDDNPSSLILQSSSGTFTITDSIIIDRTEIGIPLRLNIEDNKSFDVGVMTNTRETLNFSVSYTLDDNFTVSLFPISLRVNNTNFVYTQFNVSSNATTEIGLHTGFINITRLSPYYNSTIIPLNIDVTNLIGDVEMYEDSDSSISSCGETLDIGYTLTNLGDYNVSDCNATLSYLGANVVTLYNFLIEPGDVSFITISYPYRGSIDEVLTFDVDCAATPSGTRDGLSGVLPKLYLTAKPADECDGGSPPPAPAPPGPEVNITEIIEEYSARCGDHICQDGKNNITDNGENPWNCPEDCIQEIWELDDIFCFISEPMPCGNWATTWFINLMIIAIVIFLIIFQVYSNKAGRLK